MIVEVPGYKTLDLRYLLLDYNGTVALDGQIPEEIKKLLVESAKEFEIYILTADTHGTAKAACEGLPVKILTFPGDAAMYEKQRILRKVGPEYCVAIGNGRNDVLMCEEAALSIAIIGEEGAYGKLVSTADICVTTMGDSLNLLLKPKRLIATLRG